MCSRAHSAYRNFKRMVFVKSQVKIKCLRDNFIALASGLRFDEISTNVRYNINPGIDSWDARKAGV